MDFSLPFILFVGGIVKKIILDCDHPRTAEVGLMYYWINLGKALSELCEPAVEERIQFFLRPEEQSRFPVPLAQIYRKKWYSRYVMPFTWNCDIWHTAANGARAIPLLPPKTKVVLSVQEWPGDGLVPGSYLQNDKLRHLQNLIDRSDAIVCASEHILQLIKLNLKTRQKKLVKITNGANELPDVPPYPTKYRPYLPFIFTVGDVEAHKLIHLLVALLADPNIELVIAGRVNDKAYAEQIRKMAWDKNVSDRVRFTGPISDSDKAWYFRNCRAFALPSRSSGSGGALLEALRYGKPIFLSDNSPLSEIGADVCFYFDGFSPEELFRTYTQGLKDFTKMNYASRMMSRARDFNWSNQAAQYLELYRDLLR